jgi:hypothetical protein
MGFHGKFMVKKLLLGILLFNFCSAGKVAGSAVPKRAMGSFSSKRNVKSGYRRGKKKKSVKLEKSDPSQSISPEQEIEALPLPPPQQVEAHEIVPMICNQHVLDVYRSSESTTGLWQAMLSLKMKVLQSHQWKGSKGIRNLVYHLAEMYKSADQDTRDAITLYFLIIADSYIGELADGDDDEAADGDDEEAEEEASNFASSCLVDEDE